MKKQQFIFFTLLMLILSGCCNQQENGLKTTKAEDKIAVENAMQSLNDAIVSPEKEALKNICSEALSYGHSSGLIQDRDTFIDDVINGSFDFSSVKSEAQSIEISEDTAIVRNIFLAEATNNGVDIDIHLGNVLVFQRQYDGQWKLLARQAYKLKS
tara:strand:+ start:1056 stop:1523 length:468 start_codon:yes stop_codon:yes gene_type:complete